jgi:hypothetical protein
MDAEGNFFFVIINISIIINKRHNHAHTNKHTHKHTNADKKEQPWGNQTHKQEGWASQER